jgi:hypothetical protein
VQRARGERLSEMAVLIKISVITESKVQTLKYFCKRSGFFILYSPLTLAEAEAMALNVL